MKETLNGFIFKCVSHSVGPKGQSTFMEKGGPTQVGLSKQYFVHPNIPKKKLFILALEELDLQFLKIQGMRFY